MFKTLFALLARQNHTPSSLLERMGDYFIFPLGYEFDQMQFEIITRNNSQFLYDVPYEFSKADFFQKKIMRSRILGLLLSPLALVGFLIKCVALLQSSRMREVYLHWEKPAAIEYTVLNYRKEEDTQVAKMYNNLHIINASVNAKKAYFLLDEIAHDYKKWLIHYIQDGFTPGYLGFGFTYMSLTPEIKECVCQNSGHFNRFLNQRRQRIEANITNYLSSQKPREKIIYLSLGADGLLQELMMAHIFLSQGLNADVHLVDPHFEISEDRAVIYRYAGLQKMNGSQYMIDFLQAAAKEVGLTINIYFYNDINEVVIKNFDIITAIDFDEIFKEKSFGVNALCDAQSRLKLDGRLYLSYDVRDFVYDRTSCLYSSHVDELILKKRTETRGPANEKAQFKRWQKPSLSKKLLQRHASWSPSLFHEKASKSINDVTITTDDTPALCRPIF